MLAVALGWVPFRAESFAGAFDYYAALFGQSAGDYAVAMRDIAPEGFANVLIPGVIIALWPLSQEVFTNLRKRLPQMSMRTPEGLTFALTQGALALLFIACAAMLAGGAYNPFIYFRF